MRSTSSLGLLRWSGMVMLALCAVGCGDLTSSTGKQGRLEFQLATDYEVKQGELTDATIVAGHEQHLSVDLTSKGEDDIEEPNEIAYRVKPSENATVKGSDPAKDEPPDVTLLITKPGNYELEAVYKGKVVDSISLKFDVPDALEISVQTRKPFEDKFHDAPKGQTVEVPEGTQATFLPIPLHKGERLAGEIKTEVKATPKELVVPGKGSSFVYEQSVWSAEGNIDFYFIDPGEVTITISDPVSGASGEYSFTVTNVGA